MRKKGNLEYYNDLNNYWGQKPITLKQYKNMEPKKKINWLRIWQIIRDILVGILTTDMITDKI